MTNATRGRAVFRNFGMPYHVGMDANKEAELKAHIEEVVADYVQDDLTPIYVDETRDWNDLVNDIMQAVLVVLK